MTRGRTVRVAGIFALGLFEFDSAYGFVSLDLAKRLLAKDQPDLIQLRVNDIYSANAIARSIEEELGDTYSADDWSRMNQSLFSALWLEKMAISITIGLIVMVGALNIISSLILLVRQKSRDIAILKTMGTSSRRVMGIFMMQGLVIGVVGTDRRRLERAGVVLGPRSLSADSDSDGRVSGLACPIRRAAMGSAHRRRRHDPHLLPGHDLSVASGVDARSGASAPL